MYFSLIFKLCKIIKQKHFVSSKMKCVDFFVIFCAILHSVTSDCTAQNILTSKQYEQSDIIEVVVNSSKLELNRTNITDYLGFSKLIDIENFTLADISPIQEQEDRYFIADRRRTCLENVTKCLAEDAVFSLKSEKITRLLFSKSPPFDLSKVNGVGNECKQQSIYFRQELQRLNLWALKMYDASAKLPSGLLNGNINQLGDFDMCLATQSPGMNVKGKYCLSYLQIDVPIDSVYMEVLHDLVHGHSPFRSQLNDPGHRVPRYSTINWALCVPNACEYKDVELGIKEYVQNNLELLGLEVQVQVNEEMCQVKNDDPINNLPTSTIVGGAFFLIIILLAIISTIIDYKFEKPNDILVAFSLIRNTKSLFSLDRPAGDIASVHGIRFLNALMLIAAHKSMALFFNPYINRVEMSEILGQPWSVLGRAASLYTDPFIMLSGMLTAHSFLGRLNRTGNINIAQEYVSRLFRLVPPLGALILFCTLVLPWLGSGPQWNLVVTHHSEICKDTWWRNLLFIHNYFGFENMCLTHTHHVGIDTQLFFFSPILIWLLWKWPQRGSIALMIMAIISTMMRYYITYTMHLSNYVHFGTSVRQLFDTANYMYILPAHRLTVYIIGILLGYILRNFKKISFKTVHIQIGDALAILMFSLAFFGPAFMGSINYKYDPTDAAWYAAFAPIAWCFSFAWVIYKSHFGHEGLLGKIFSWKGFLVTTRLSYAIYLTQFPIFFYNVGVTRSSEQYTFVRMQINVPELINIFLYSVILTLLFDTPFQNIKKIIFKKSKPVPSDSVKRKEVKTD